MDFPDNAKKRYKGIIIRLDALLANQLKKAVIAVPRPLKNALIGFVKLEIKPTPTDATCPEYIQIARNMAIAITRPASKRISFTSKDA